MNSQKDTPKWLMNHLTDFVMNISTSHIDIIQQLKGNKSMSIQLELNLSPITVQLPENHIIISKNDDEFNKGSHIRTLFILK